MDTAPSQTGDDGVDIDGLVCRMVGVFERLADRARFQQIDVNIVRPGFPRPVAEAMQSPQKVTDLQKWLVVCHQFRITPIFSQRDSARYAEPFTPERRQGRGRCAVASQALTALSVAGLSLTSAERWKPLSRCDPTKATDSVR
jgi:hypothetical protein